MSRILEKAFNLDSVGDRYALRLRTGEVIRFIAATKTRRGWIELCVEEHGRQPDENRLAYPGEKAFEVRVADIVWVMEDPDYTDEMAIQKRTVFYGVKSPSLREVAWFHTREAANRYYDHFKGPNTSIVTSSTVDPDDMMDTLESPWRLKTV